MKITKARLKEIIKEEMQSEILGTYFASKAMKKNKSRSPSYLTFFFKSKIRL